jgi:hypothetical protein
MEIVTPLGTFVGRKEPDEDLLHKFNILIKAFFPRK